MSPASVFRFTYDLFANATPALHAPSPYEEARHGEAIDDVHNAVPQPSAPGLRLSPPASTLPSDLNTSPSPALSSHPNFPYPYHADDHGSWNNGLLLPRTPGLSSSYSSPDVSLSSSFQITPDSPNFPDRPYRHHALTHDHSIFTSAANYSPVRRPPDSQEVTSAALDYELRDVLTLNGSPASPQFEPILYPSVPFLVPTTAPPSRKRLRLDMPNHGKLPATPTPPMLSSLVESCSAGLDEAQERAFVEGFRDTYPHTSKDLLHSHMSDYFTHEASLSHPQGADLVKRILDASIAMLFLFEVILKVTDMKDSRGHAQVRRLGRILAPAYVPVVCRGASELARAQTSCTPIGPTSYGLRSTSGFSAMA
ncbi:hypothetical protein BOTBODRAFT_463954 [Botryobasidium botryosum FD-172 SS1]|uniref:Uncharacterized protein n=1 Tax=Botryobasidium botryosum (strain FD-172 SS1) TaxID=930990 RepID=A0A067M680_BOTB1|nr:hypothetical protein BOTBODRAFT_463954 [Botryobasidium botryosum FD-172 SS1]